MSGTFVCPGGSSTFASVTTVATSIYVTSVQPVNKWYIVNTGTTPVYARFNANLATTVTAGFPTAGTNTLGTTINGSDSLIVQLPSNLNGTITGSPSAPFTSNIQISLIGTTGTANVYVTPVV